MVSSLQNTSVDWGYAIEKTKKVGNLLDHNVTWPSGKFIGGSAGMNVRFYVRGNPRDFDEWEYAGNPTWNWSNMLQYFKKIENYQSEVSATEANTAVGSTDELHGKTGPLPINYFVNDSPFKQTLFDAARELGHPAMSDVNGRQYVGIGRAPGTISQGKLFNAAKAYLSPAKDRTNLDVIKYAHVTRVNVDNTTGQVTGVTFQINRTIEFAAVATKETILSAGSIGTPKILQLSGIGLEKYLTRLGLPVVRSLSTGFNLQNHITVPLFVQFNVSNVQATETGTTTNAGASANANVNANAAGAGRTFGVNVGTTPSAGAGSVGAGKTAGVYIGTTPGVNVGASPDPSVDATAANTDPNTDPNTPTTTEPGVDSTDALYDYIKQRTDIASLQNIFDVLGFFSTVNSPYPNIGTQYTIFKRGDQLLLTEYLKQFGLNATVAQPIIDANAVGDIAVIFVTILNPITMGKVRLRSLDPYDPPMIQSNFLDRREDVATLVQGVQFARSFLQTTPFQNLSASEVVLSIPQCETVQVKKKKVKPPPTPKPPKPSKKNKKGEPTPPPPPPPPPAPLEPEPLPEPIPYGSDQYFECYVKQLSTTLYNPVGTSKMGPAVDRFAVVDSRLKVHGLNGLRVVDASIMPKIISAPPNAATIAIAEKASDIIKEDWPAVDPAAPEATAHDEL